jgi:GT2 family glycosyltransferase
MPSTADLAPVDAPEKLPKASVIIVNYNGLDHLKRCLPSLLAQRYGEYEVLVIDNGSSDGSVEYVECVYPQVTAIRSATNLGYGGANNVGFEYASGEYLAMLNPDTVVEADWLRELVLALEKTPGAGLATSRVLLLGAPKRINACGNDITYTGLTVCRGLGQSADRYPHQEVVPAVSGSAFAIKRSVLEHIGGFDDTFFLYYEDTDLSLRAALAGYDCVYVPTSVVYHDYSFRFSAHKGSIQERNRIFSWLKTFRWGTLLALSPALLLAELLAWGYSMLHGVEHVRSKAQSYTWVAENWQQIAEARRRTQALRRVGDRQLVHKMSHHLNLTQTTSPQVARALEAIVQPLLWVWGGLCRAVVVW